MSLAHIISVFECEGASTTGSMKHDLEVLNFIRDGTGADIPFNDPESPVSGVGSVTNVMRGETGDQSYSVTITARTLPPNKERLLTQQKTVTVVSTDYDNAEAIDSLVKKGYDTRRKEGARGQGYKIVSHDALR